MMRMQLVGLVVLAASLAMLTASCGLLFAWPEAGAPEGKAASAKPSFAEFDRRARAGERLNVVFFGASLTWGANASDPMQTSYRALVAQRLEKTYPEARFKFLDAAIGGTNSQLGLFRFERDVLAKKPDLVFVDFSANDDIYSGDEETLASYEAIVRRIILEAKCPVELVIFPFQWNVQAGNLDVMKRRIAHLTIGMAYNAPVGDAIGLAVERVKSGATTIEKIWPVDGVHPCDAGYVVFADAAWDSFVDAVKREAVCAAPEEMVYAPTYMTSARVRISTLGALPAGWTVRKPNVVSAYFDMLMSRWLDHETVASNRREVVGADGQKKSEPCQPAPLKVKFNGAMVMLFGESTQKSSKYRVSIDGKLIEHKSSDGKEMLKEYDGGFLANMVKGNAHHYQVIATGLDPSREHTLEIEPVMAADPEQELRLESICVAGGQAKVWLAD